MKKENGSRFVTYGDMQRLIQQKEVRRQTNICPAVYGKDWFAEEFSVLQMLDWKVEVADLWTNVQSVYDSLVYKLSRAYTMEKNLIASGLRGQYEEDFLNKALLLWNKREEMRKTALYTAIMMQSSLTLSDLNLNLNQSIISSLICVILSVFSQTVKLNFHWIGNWATDVQSKFQINDQSMKIMGMTICDELRGKSVIQFKEVIEDIQYGLDRLGCV